MQLQGANIVTIRGDGAGELGRSSTFREELKKLKLKWESTPPYTHQQQGLVERAIRQIVEGGRAQLARASLGDKFWTWACKDFAFKSNCIPHQALGGDSPFERLHSGRKPRFQALRKFGQTAYVHIDKSRQGEFSRGKLNKMRPRSERGILVGHAMGASAYLIYLPKMNKVVTSSAVVFNEIPTEIPFMSGRPEHWTSPAPGIDDAAPVEAEELSAETTCDDMPEGQPKGSAFDGRDIPRPQRGPKIMDNRLKTEETEAMSNHENRAGPELRRGTRTRIQFDPQRMPSGTREIVELDRLIKQDSDDEEEDNFTYCMLADRDHCRGSFSGT